MANPEHLDWLREGVNRWNKRSRRPGRVFEQAAHRLVGKIDANGLVAGDDIDLVDDNIDLDASASGHVVAKFAVHPDVGLLRGARRAVVLEAATQFVRLADIVSGGILALEAEAVEARPAGRNRKQQAAVFGGLHLSEELPPELEADADRILGHVCHVCQVGRRSEAWILSRWRPSKAVNDLQGRAGNRKQAPPGRG